MTLKIRQCRFCPLRESCEHRKTLLTEAATVCKGITVSHNCAIYKNQFKIGDEVTVEIQEMHYKTNYGEPEPIWTKAGEFRGVIFYIPKNNTASHFGVAFKEPIKIFRGNEEEEFTSYGAKADKIKYIGKYEGKKFWEPEYDFSEEGKEAVELAGGFF